MAQTRDNVQSLGGSGIPTPAKRCEAELQLARGSELWHRAAGSMVTMPVLSHDTRRPGGKEGNDAS